MSDAPAITREPEPRRPLSPEASNLLGWWWLALVFSIVLLIAIWPRKVRRFIVMMLFILPPFVGVFCLHSSLLGGLAPRPCRWRLSTV